MNVKPAYIVVGALAAVTAITGSVLLYRMRRRSRNALGATHPSRNEPFVINIEEATLDNEDYRRVLTTSPHSQLVLMAIAPGDDIGVETHPDTDQFLRIEGGAGRAVIDGKHYRLRDGTAVTVPAGSQHNIINASRTEPLKLYSIYSPAHHPPGTVQRTKPEAY